VRTILATVAVVVGLVIYDLAVRDLLRRPVEFWQATVPVDLLLLGLWPALHERVTRARSAFWLWWKDNTVAGTMVLLTAFMGIGWAEWSGLLPFVAPPITAVVFGGSALLAGAAFIARAKAADWRLKLVAAAFALSQSAFAAYLLVAIHRPDLGQRLVGASVVGAVAALADLIVRAPQRERQRHERQLTRVRSVPQEP
jgi:hypothetical protein